MMKHEPGEAIIIRFAGGTKFTIRGVKLDVLFMALDQQMVRAIRVTHMAIDSELVSVLEITEGFDDESE